MLNCCIERKRARAANKDQDDENESETDEQNETAPEPLEEQKAPEKEEEETKVKTENETAAAASSQDVVVMSESKPKVSKMSVSSNKSGDGDVSDDDDEFYECESGSESGVEFPPSKMLRAELEEQLDDVTTSCDVTASPQNLESGDSNQNATNEEKTDTCDNNASKTEVTNDAAASDTSFNDVCDRQPEGRSQRCGELRLLGNESEYVWVPVTQDTAPMTEDMLEEHAEVLAR